MAIRGARRRCSSRLFGAARPFDGLSLRERHPRQGGSGECGESGPSRKRDLTHSSSSSLSLRGSIDRFRMALQCRMRTAFRFRLRIAPWPVLPRLAATGGVPPHAAVSLCAASTSIPLTSSARAAVSRLTGPEIVNAPTRASPMPKTGMARAAAWGSVTPEVNSGSSSSGPGGPASYRCSTWAIADLSIGRVSPGCTCIRIRFTLSTRNRQRRSLPCRT